jgi:hypothetical protein
VEANAAFAGILFEIGGDVAQTDGHDRAPWQWLRGAHYAQESIEIKRINNDLSITKTYNQEPS